ncbi:MAG: hypothetical protein FD172_1642, partial [Methylocystaceae bacterium]
LVASLTAPWDNAAREAARVILSRIAAEEEARTTRDVRASLPTLSEHILKEAEANFGAGLRDIDDESATFSCPANNVAALADWLIARGAKSVTSARLDYIFQAENALWSRLAARLG